MAIPYAITAERVKKSYGEVAALQDVSIAVVPASILALLGPNGAGKTTLVRILTTLLLPDAGRASVAGFDVLENPAAVRERIGLAGQYAAVDENLTGRENLEMVGRLYHIGKSEARRRAGELLERFQLSEAANRTLKTYSGGMRRRLDLAASLVGAPEVLFLDEPTAGLDPRSRLELWEVLEELVRGGTTVLLTTQYLDEADYLAHRIAVIDRGRLIAEGTSADLKSRIGGDVLELHMADRAKAAKAIELIAPLGRAAPHVDDISGEISLPVADGIGVLIEAVRRLDRARLEIVNIELRRPSLDEVFLALTGRAVSKEPAARAVGTTRRTG